MTPQALRGLLALAEARMARDLATLERLGFALRALEAEIAEARAAPARDLAAGGQDSAPLRVQGLRLVWAQQRIAAAGREKAALAGPLAQARAAAVRSLGKHRALERLLERAEATQAATRAARAERDAATDGRRAP